MKKIALLALIMVLASGPGFAAQKTQSKSRAWRPRTHHSEMQRETTRSRVTETRSSEMQFSPSQSSGMQPAKEQLPPPVVATTDWGATTPDTQINWNYPDSPSPSFQGTPDYFVIGFSFPKGSAALNQEARGSTYDKTADLTAGGDIDDVKDARILVIGFADGLGERRMGERLGMERAQAARNLLVNMGYSRENIQVATFGSRYSTATVWEPNKQKAERQVEVWALK